MPLTLSLNGDWDFTYMPHLSAEGMPQFPPAFAYEVKMPYDPVLQGIRELADRATPGLTSALRSFLKRGGMVIAQASQVPLIPEEFQAITVKGQVDSAEDLHAEVGGRDYTMAGTIYRLTLVDAAQPVHTVYGDRTNRPVVLWSQAGKGGVFWVLGDSRQILLPVIPDLLKQIADHALPVKVTGDVQWLANKTKAGWVIGLLNNRGVSVKAIDPYPEEIDPREEEQVTIEYSGKMGEVWEWLRDQDLSVKREGTSSFLSVTVPARDVRMVQFRAPPH
jgi:hypothetical protein